MIVKTINFKLLELIFSIRVLWYYSLRYYQYLDFFPTAYWIKKTCLIICSLEIFNYFSIFFFVKIGYATLRCKLPTPPFRQTYNLPQWHLLLKMTLPILIIRNKWRWYTCIFIIIQHAFSNTLIFKSAFKNN